MHICMDEIRLVLPWLGYVAAFALPWLGWLRSWWHHRRVHPKCVREQVLAELAALSQKHRLYDGWGGK